MIVDSHVYCFEPVDRPAGHASADRGKFSLLTLMKRYPGVLEWLRLKSALSLDLLSDWRETLTKYGGGEKELSANAFMPPFSLFTGFDFAGAAEYCTSISPKLYTMHWAVMVQFWGEVLLTHNPGLDETLVAKALAHHEPQVRKIEQVVAGVGDRVQITPLVHGYGPLDDFCRRLQLVADSPAHGVWINRYGYLSDEKLDEIGKIWT